MNNSEINNKNRQEREGMTLCNNQGYKMKLIKYHNTRNVVVEFEDGTQVDSSWACFKSGGIKKPEIKLNRVFSTNEGYEIKVISFNSYSDVTVEFQDKWKQVVHTTWGHCKSGNVKNRYHPNKYGGIVGDIRPSKTVNKMSKEYIAWYNILVRCYEEKIYNKYQSYEQCEICEEWKYYWNFYDWLHSQSNFEKWKNGTSWAVDKDIIIKNNKIYSPQTCCLVPKEVNNLLLKSEQTRGDLPIGVTYRKSDGMYEAQCSDPFLNKYITIGIYNTPQQAFKYYKQYKENILQRMANQQYQLKNINKQCYDALMNYVVEITD